jgi:hypothetical protein
MEVLRWRKVPEMAGGVREGHCCSNFLESARVETKQERDG